MSALFENFAKNEIGTKAKEYFLQNGLPNKSNEDFHYTDLSHGLAVDIEFGTSVLNISGADFKDAKIENANGIGLVTSGLAKNIKQIDISSDNNKIIIDAEGQNAIIINAIENSNSEIYINNKSNIFNSLYLIINTKSKANLKLILQNSNEFLLNTIIINQEKDSEVSFFGLYNGGKLNRTDLTFNLNGEFAKANINAAYLLDKAQIDFTSLVNHNAPNCSTSETVRGIVNKGAVAVFQGKILVNRIAQKTNANMEHRGIMLEDGAKINAKPGLEIYADDVECSHGNTIGALDDSALFYMQSRGITKAKAKAILTEAFIAKVFDDLDNDELKQTITNKLEDMIK